jgi:malate dehydrogenase (oxaloacetate-decarboxylating)(NADP+)
VATRPIENWDAYHQHLTEMTTHTGAGMRAIFQAARHEPKRRVVYAEGEDERVLRAAQIIREERLAAPILVGRPAVIEKKLTQMGLRIRPGVDFEIVNPQDDPRYKELWTAYHQIAKRQGVTIDIAKVMARTNHTVIGALLVKLGYADGLICGVTGTYSQHLLEVERIIGKAPGHETLAAMNLLLLPGRSLFICDTHVNEDPTPGQVADIALMAAEGARRFGITPKAALLSHSNFGSSDCPSAQKMRAALPLIRARDPRLEVDGEMHGDSALSEAIRMNSDPQSPLKGEANLLVMPNLDAANITYNLMKMVGSHGITIGPVLLGAAQPVHILTSSASVRRIINLTALVATERSLGGCFHQPASEK